MIRNDFVSNSSSSSFIVSSEDNKYDILLNKYDVLTLEQYIDHFLMEDIRVYSYYYNDKAEDYNFVSDAVFNKRFEYNIRKTLPESCRVDWEKYISECKKNTEKHTKKMDSALKSIKKKVLECLKFKWKDVKFHYSEIDDFYCYDEENEREDGIENNVDLTKERIEYLRTLKELKFYRYFCHH